MSHPQNPATLFKKVTSHPVVPTALGTAVAVTGHSEMFIRSIAMVVFALWLCIDVGIWLWESEWPPKPWKPMVFASVSCVSLLSVMIVMRWFLVSTLEDQQTDVYNKLSAQAFLPPSGDPHGTMFTITNGGNTTIGGQHEIMCFVNLVTDRLGGTTRHIGQIHTLSSVRILPGGDARSDPCLNVTIHEGANCFDVTVLFSYVLETQPADVKQKRFRFVAIVNGVRFMWNRQPVELRQSYCEGFLRR